MEEYEYDVDGLTDLIERYLGFMSPGVQVYEAQDMDSSRTGQPTATVEISTATVAIYIHPFEGEIPTLRGPRTTMLWAVDQRFDEGDTEEIGDYRRIIDAIAVAAGPIATALVEEEYALYGLVEEEYADKA